ncbi:peptidoglycan-N-acetylglucosamine deacetylase [Sphingomonas sp. F9_3S_D5_B_2]
MSRLATAAAAFLLLESAAPAQSAAHPQIAITIDDLPVHAPYPPGLTALQVNRQMIAALKAAHVPVTGFVNAVNVKDAGTRQALREWRSAGFVLGNHTWSHPHLSEMTIPQFEEELTKDEPTLSKLGGRSDWRWFRYPFLDEGKDPDQRVAARAVLAKHGYRVADVTTGFSDWAWTPAYARCSAKHDGAGVAQLERRYLTAVRKSIVDDRESARKLYGRDVPYVLLMHVSAMSAHMMSQVLRIYRQAGYRFVSLAEAEKDPVYRAYTDLKLAPPPSRGEAAKQRHVKLPAPPDYSATLAEICA